MKPQITGDVYLWRVISGRKGAQNGHFESAFREENMRKVAAGLARLAWKVETISEVMPVMEFQAALQFARWLLGC